MTSVHDMFAHYCTVANPKNFQDDWNTVHDIEEQLAL